MARTTLTLLSLAAAIFATAATAAAQDEEATEEEPAEPAFIDHTQTYERAARRAGRNDISGAIELFESITVDDPYWSDVYYNIGQLAPRIERHALCSIALRRYQFLEPEAPDFDDVTEDIAECDAHIVDAGFLVIPSTTPEGVQVAIDGTVLGEGSVPTVALPPGPHTITATRPEYDPYEVTVNIEPGQTLTHALEMAAIVYTGEMVFEVSEAGATVLIDGTEVGVAPLENLVRPEGRYLVEVRAEGFYPWQRYINVDRDDPALVEATLISEDVDLSDLQ